MNIRHRVVLIQGRGAWVTDTICFKAGGGAGQTAIPYSLHAYMESFT